MTAINTMVKRIGGLIGTKDLTDWEDDFVADIVERTHDGYDTSMLSEKQVDIVERIFRKHFSG